MTYFTMLQKALFNYLSTHKLLKDITVAAVIAENSAYPCLKFSVLKSTPLQRFQVDGSELIVHFDVFSREQSAEQLLLILDNLEQVVIKWPHHHASEFQVLSVNQLDRHFQQIAYEQLWHGELQVKISCVMKKT